jgi:2-phosphosulfolactate phosphatase
MQGARKREKGSPMMQIDFATLDDCRAATGTAVVIDVCRAFTTAAFSFAVGAAEILLVAEVQEAFDLRERLPGSLIMGEVGGMPVEGFDFGNSPNQFAGADLEGRRLIQRTSAGTQGVVLCQGAKQLLTASFVVAQATVRALQRQSPGRVTLVTTGHRSGGPAVEDAACADYLAALLCGASPDVAPFLDRAREWLSIHVASQVAAPALEGFAQDLERCLEVDRFDFGMEVARENGLLIMRPTPCD